MATSQETYNQYKSGYRYITSFGIPRSYACNNCSIYLPPGYYESSTRGIVGGSYPNGGGSQDAAWDEWIVNMGGKTVAMTQQEQSALAAVLAAEAEQRATLALQQKLAAEAEQIALKTSMLQSQNAVWGNPDTYKAELAETTQEIRAYNSDVAAFLATAPAGDVANAQQAGAGIKRKPEARNNTNILLIGAGVAVAAVGALYVTRRK